MLPRDSQAFDREVTVDMHQDPEFRWLERGAPLFPVDPDAYAGEPIAFLAGDPIAHDESLREVLEVG